MREASLGDIWTGAEALRFTRNDRRSELWGHCATCYYGADCLGGCSWTAHSLFGRRGNNPYCHHRALELLRVGRRERLVKVAEGPREPFEHARSEVIEEEWPAAELTRARDVAADRARWLVDPAGSC